MESDLVDSESDSDSDGGAGGAGRIVTGLFGICTFSALVSLVWLITGNQWLITLVVTAVAVVFILENLAFFEEIRTLERAVKMKETENVILRRLLATGTRHSAKSEQY